MTEKKKEPAILQLTLEQKDNGDTEMAFMMNHECVSLMEQIKVGPTTFEPLINKISEHLNLAATNNPVIVDTLKPIENTLFNISIHFDSENLFYMDYSSSADEIMQEMYGEEYINEKKTFLEIVGMALNEFNSSIKRLQRNETSPKFS